MEDYSKENLDKIVKYAKKILSDLKDSANENDKSLEESKRRYENLRNGLQDILNKN